MAKQLITKTAIQRILKESVLDPREHGPLKLIIDQHKDDPDYLEKKALELINEARYAINCFVKTASMGPTEIAMQTNQTLYNDQIAKAVFFLTVARIIRNN